MFHIRKTHCQKWCGGHQPAAAGISEMLISMYCELDATDVFVSLIAQKYSQRNNKEYLAKKQDLEYNKDKVQSDRVPSGLCG